MTPLSIGRTSMIPFMQEGVRKKFPGAILRTDGYMYWVESVDSATSAVAPEMISRRSMDEYKAWRSALDFASAR